MGRQKRSLADNNGTNTSPLPSPTRKKSKKSSAKEEKPAAVAKNAAAAATATAKSSAKAKNEATAAAKRERPQISTDTSSSSESDSEKNSVKNEVKSEKSVSGSNSGSDSDSDSDSDSSGSDSSQGSKPERGGNGSIPAAGRAANSVVNFHPVKSSYDSPPKSSGSDSYHSDTEEEDKKRRKKQKELLKMQLNKKNKRASERRWDPFFDRADSKDEEDGDDTQGNSDADVTNWPKSDVNELIRRMEDQIPAGDNQRFDLMVAKLDWEKIAFGDHSQQDCQEKWNQMSKRIRRYRYLAEMLADAKELAKRPWKASAGVRKNKHSEPYGKAPSSYMFYYLEQKGRVMEENKDLSVEEVSKMLMERYKNLSEKERQNYLHRAAMDKHNLKEKLSEFYNDHPGFKPRHKAKTKPRDPIKGPRKPYSPFKLYFQDMFDHFAMEGPVEKKELVGIAKERWKHVSDKKKAEWIRLSLADLRRFEDEAKAFSEENPEYVMPNYSKSIMNKEEKLIWARFSGKPLRPPRSAYNMFSRHMLQCDDEVKSKAPKLRMAEVSKKWKELSSSEKKKYEEKVRQLQVDYKSKFQSYMKSLSPEERAREMESIAKRNKKVNKMKKAKKGLAGKSKNNVKKTSKKSVFDGEPKAPPETECELFVERFLADAPSNANKDVILKKALDHWEKLPESKKAAFTEKLVKLKKKYVEDYKTFLRSLTAEELWEYKARKEKASKEEKLRKVNGTLTDSNDESEEEKGNSSSDDDDDDSSSNESASGKSKSSSSSDDSDG